MQVDEMQFSTELQSENRLMFYNSSSPPVRCSCGKCYQRSCTDYERRRERQREDFDKAIRDRYMYSSRTFPFPSTTRHSSAFPYPLPDPRHFYPGSAIPSSLQYYAHDRATSEYGRWYLYWRTIAQTDN